MIVSISGPTGAGKTTLARLLRDCGFKTVEEEIPVELFKAFSSAPAKYCEAVQRHILQARFEGWRNISDFPLIAFDRTISEDIEIFCRMHLKSGLLTQEQFNDLTQYAHNLEAQIPKPDLTIFVSSDKKSLIQRLQTLGAPSVIIENIEVQLSLYSEWLQNQHSEILELNTGRLSNATITKLLSEICSC